MAWAWLRRLLRRGESSARRELSEVEKRFELAMLRTREETAALEDDGAALAKRIKRNMGRASLGGSKAL